MNTNQLMDTLASFKQNLPAELGILELRRAPIDELQRRLRKLLRSGGDACDKAYEHGQWTTYEDRTLVRLPQGAYAVVYHASGAVKLSAGQAPMDNLFKEPEPRALLTQRAEAFVQALGLHDSLGRSESLAFERLWQVKAAAADRSGKMTDTVLCRAVGAFRHHIEGIPVLGPASVAVQIAGDGSLDTLSTLMRAPAGEVLETARLLPPERVARQMTQRVAERFAHTKGELEIQCHEGMRFGYLSLPKRKLQRVLAPVYIASFDVTHEQERQGFVLALPATEKSYLPLDPPGSESIAAATGKLSARRCC